MRLPPTLLASDRSEKAAWKVVSTLGGVAGGIVARSVLQKVWAVASRSDLEPPLNPADRRISWPNALQWAIASGIGVGVARLLSERVVAAGWEAATGSPPPGVAT